MTRQLAQVMLENAYNHSRFKGAYFLVGYSARIDRTGQPFWETTLSDASDQIKVYCRDESCIYSDLTPLSLVEVEVRTEMSGLQPHFRCKYIEKSGQVLPKNGSLAQLPSSLCPIPGAVKMLADVVGEIETKSLRDFVRHVLLQPQVALRFIQCPASLRYHHNYQGGLLTHSLEVALMFLQNKSIKQLDKDIGVAAALLHDIGKTQTLTPDLNRTATGTLVDHDKLTLELCSTALETLAEKHSNISDHLRHIWTCESEGSRYGFKAKTNIAHLLRNYDRASAFGEKATAC